MRATMIAAVILALYAGPAVAASAADAGRRPRRTVDDARLLERAMTGPPVASPGDEPSALNPNPSFLTTGAAIPDAISWLATNENPTGSWGTAFEFADTATVVDGLGRAQLLGSPYALGFGWLSGHASSDSDELSRKVLAMRHVTTMDLNAFADSLLAARSPATTNPSAPNFPEGGWGLAAGYETDNLTTGLALLALESAGRKAGLGVVSEPLAAATTKVHTWTIATGATKARITVTVSGATVRLRMKQGSAPTGADPFFTLTAPGSYLIVFPDSGLPFTAGTNFISVENPNAGGGASATYTFTASYETPTFDTRAFADAVAYVRAAQNGDGGWGIQKGDATSLYITEHIILAMLRWRDYDFDAELASAITYLRGQQAVAGTWGSGAGQAYLTALGAIDLIEYEICPFSTDTHDAINALLTLKSGNGSWNSQPYDTGLALRALWEYDKDGDGIFADADCSGTAGDHPCVFPATTGCDDDCIDYFNPTQDKVVFPQSVTAADNNTFVWPNPVDTVFVKGNVQNVSTYGVTAGGALPWSNTLSTYGDVPLLDKAFYYLFKLAGNCTTTSWQSVLGAEPGRDAAPLGSITVAITSPASGAVLTSSPAAVTGTVTGAEPVTVTVNGVAATAAAGAFTASVPLVRGANTLTAVGVDAIGFMGTSPAISVTLVDYSIPKNTFVTGSRIFTAASSVLDQTAFFTENRSGVPAGVTYTTTAVQRISATQMQVSFRIDATNSATPGIYFFQVTYGLLNSSMQPLGPLTGNVFDFQIRVTP